MSTYEMRQIRNDCAQARMMMIQETLRLICDMRTLHPVSARWSRPELREELRTSLFAVLGAIDALVPRTVPARAKHRTTSIPPSPFPQTATPLGIPGDYGHLAQDGSTFDAFSQAVNSTFSLLFPSTLPTGLASPAEAMLLLTEGGYMRFISEQATAWAFADDLAEKKVYLAAYPGETFKSVAEMNARGQALPQWGRRWSNLTPTWLAQSLLWNTPDARCPDTPGARIEPPNAQPCHPLDGESSSCTIEHDLGALMGDLASTLVLYPDPGQEERRVKLCEVLARTGILPTSLLGATSWALAWSDPIKVAGLADFVLSGEALRWSIDSKRSAHGAAPPSARAYFTDVEDALALDDRRPVEPDYLDAWRTPLLELAGSFAAAAGDLWHEYTGAYQAVRCAERVLSIYCDIPLLEAATAVGAARPARFADDLYGDALVELQRTVLFYQTLQALVYPMGRTAGAALAVDTAEVSAYGLAMRDYIRRVGDRMPDWLSRAMHGLRDILQVGNYGPSMWGQPPADLPIARTETLGVELLRAWTQTTLLARYVAVHIDRVMVVPGREAFVRDMLRGAVRMIPGASWLVASVQEEEARRLPALFGSGLYESAVATLGDIRLGAPVYGQLLAALGVPHSADMASRFSAICSAEGGVTRTRLVALLDTAQAHAQPPPDDEPGLVSCALGMIRDQVLPAAILSPLALRAHAILARAAPDRAQVAATMDPEVLVNALAVKYELRCAAARQNIF